MSSWPESGVLGWSRLRRGRRSCRSPPPVCGDRCLCPQGSCCLQLLHGKGLRRSRPWHLTSVAEARSQLPGWMGGLGNDAGLHGQPPRGETGAPR